MLCLAAVGCGGGRRRAAAVVGPTRAARPRRPARKAIREPIQSRGIKGEDPSAEAASDAAHLGRRLRRPAEARRRTPGDEALAPRRPPRPPLSRCRLDRSGGTSVNVYLDSGFAANQRYHNRMEETVQFNSTDPGKVPHPVPHVGEKSAYNSAASWIPTCARCSPCAATAG